MSRTVTKRRATTPAARAPEQHRILDDYARRYYAGEFRSVQAAARDCLKRLSSLARTGSRVTAREFCTVRAYILRRVHALGAPSLLRCWSADETRIMNRYLDATLRGEYVHPAHASDDCHRELNGLWRPTPDDRWTLAPRTVKAVARRLGEQIKARGWVGNDSPFTRQELALIRRYARAVAQGYYRNTFRAALACREELIRRRQSQPRYYGVRTIARIRGPMGKLARKFGWCGAYIQFHPDEERLLRQAERKLVRGEFGNCLEAAKACRAEMVKLHKRRPDLVPRVTVTLVRHLRRRTGRRTWRRSGSGRAAAL